MAFLHHLATLYPGVSPYQFSQEPASFWLPYITILEEAGLTDG